MVDALCNPFRVDVLFLSLTQGGAARLRRFAYPGLCCFDPVGVEMNRSSAPLRGLAHATGSAGGH